MKKKTKKIIFWCTGIVVILIVLFVIFSSQCNKKSDGPPMVKVTRKNIIDKALAVGSLEPLNEISVKSKISGVVSDLYKNVGDFVKYNEPLLNIKPDPTPLELAEAKRNVQMTEIALKAVKRELQRNEELKQKGLISDHDIDILGRLILLFVA